MISLPTAGILQGRQLIVRFEGRVLHPFLDSGTPPVWTIGNGETTLLDGSPVGPHTRDLTPEECDTLTDRTLAVVFVPALQRDLSHGLSVGQTAALISLVWNIGTGAFHRSSVRDLMNRGMLHEAGTHFREFCHVDGVLSKPILRRRMAEMVVWDEAGVADEVPIAASIHAKPATGTADDLNAIELVALQGAEK